MRSVTAPSAVHSSGGQSDSIRSLIAFWLPLALMWLIMGIEQPTVGAVVSRLPDATRSLAAFEVAFGLATLIHSPIIQMLSAATAIVTGRTSYRRLVTLLTLIVAALTAIHAIVALPAVFAWVAGELLGVPEQIVPAANRAFAVFLPVTAAVGYRRMLQGVLIRVGRTKTVGAIMLLRLAATTVFLAIVLLLHSNGADWLPAGSTIAAAAFVIGITAGAFAALRAVRRHLLPALTDDAQDALELPAMLQFYTPLALTALIVMAGRPLLAFAIGRSADPVQSLAAWPLIQSYLFVFTAIALSYQEVVVARISNADQQGRRNLHVLGNRIATVLTAVLLLVTLSGANRFWFGAIVGAPRELIALILPAMAILVPMPWIVTYISIESGKLLAQRSTRWITVATVVNISVQIVLGFTLPLLRGLDGARIAAIILAAARLSQLAALWYGRRHSRPVAQVAAAQ